jgi:hypothetical protein
VRRILLQGLNEGTLIELVLVDVFLHQINPGNAVLLEHLPVLFLELVFSWQEHLALHLLVDDLSSVFVDNLDRLVNRHTGGELPTEMILKLVLIFNVDGIGKPKHPNYLLIAGIPQRPEERRDRYFFLPINVGPQHVADVGRKLHPGSSKRDNASTVKLGSVRVDLLVEEDPGTAVKLRDDDSLCTVYNKGPPIRHEREGPEVDLLLDGLNSLFVPVFFFTCESERRLQGDCIGQPLIHALLHGVLRGIQLVTHKLERVALPIVLNRKVLVKDLLETDVFPILRRDVVLDEVVKRLQLDVQEVRIVLHGRDVGKALARLCVFKMSARGNIPVK